MNKSSLISLIKEVLQEDATDHPMIKKDPITHKISAKAPKIGSKILVYIADENISRSELMTVIDIAPKFLSCEYQDIEYYVTLQKVGDHYRWSGTSN